MAEEIGNKEQPNTKLPKEDVTTKHPLTKPVSMKKSIWVPSSDVRFIKGQNDCVLNKFKSKGVNFIFNYDDGVGGGKPESSSVNIVIEGPTPMLDNIENTLIEIVEIGMEKESITLQQKQEKEELNGMDKMGTRGNNETDSNVTQNDNKANGHNWRQPVSGNKVNSFSEIDYHGSKYFSGEKRHYFENQQNYSHYNAAHYYPKRRVNNYRKYSTYHSRSSYDPYSNRYGSHYPSQQNGYDYPPYFDAHSSPYESKQRHGYRGYPHNYRGRGAPRSSFAPHGHKLNHYDSFPRTKTIKLKSLNLYRELSRCVRDHKIKTEHKGTPSEGKEDIVELTFESPPDSSFNISVMKLTRSETARLKKVYSEMPEKHPLKSTFSNCFEIHHQNFSEEMAADKHSKTTDIKPEPTAKEEIIANLGEISDFLDNFGKFEGKDIPGLSVEKDEKDEPKKVISFDEETKRSMLNERAEKRYELLTPFIRESKTLPPLVLSELSKFIIETVSEVGKIAVEKDGKKLKMPASVEKSFFSVLGKNLTNFSSEDVSRIKTAVKNYPRKLLIDFSPFSSPEVEIIKNPIVLTKPSHKKNQLPFFSRGENRKCEACFIQTDTRICSWCKHELCPSCIGNLSKPPCKQCQIKMEPLERVAVLQSISFEQGRKRITNSFENKKDFIETSFNLPLFDFFTLKRIEIPGRGRCCKHRNVFDVASFLSLLKLSDKKTANCPICKIPLGEKDIEMDKYVERILLTESEEVREVKISENGSWSSEKEKPRSVVEIKPKEKGSIDLT